VIVADAKGLTEPIKTHNDGQSDQDLNREPVECKKSALTLHQHGRSQFPKILQKL